MPLSSSHYCPGPADRRAWLKIGGLSLGALATGIVPNLADLLAAKRDAKKVDKEFSVILFWANGGPSHVDLFDLKPDAPDEFRGPFRPIRTNVAGMEITEELPLLSKLADKFTIVRSLQHERTEHSGGTNRFLTGYPSVAANLADSEFPEIGSVVAKQLDRQAPDAEARRVSEGVPLFIANTKFYGGGPAYLGPSCSPYMPSPNPVSSSGNNIYDPIPIYPTEQSNDNLTISSDGVIDLRRRKNLLETLEKLPRQLDRGENLASLDTFQRRAIEMLAGGRARKAFDLSREADRTRERYGHTHWGKSLLTCRRLVEAGARFVQCQAEFRLRRETGVTSNWDDHSVNSHIFRAYEEKLPSFDQSVSALIEDLFDRGLSEHVLFIFCGEFGRTPKIAYQDASGRPGRDHWSRAMSVLLSGGGLRMGQVIGRTNPRGEEPTDRRMDSNCLLATLYQRFGIDTRHSFENHAGRPIPILSSGEVIEELL